MKSITAVAVLIVTMHTISSAQVGIGTTAPDVSAALHIESMDAGLLIPRLTTLQRDAIILPANALTIFNTDLNLFQYNAGTSAEPDWTSLSPMNYNTSVKYSNTDVITSVNQNPAVNLPVFGSEEWNDDNSLYTIDLVNQTVTVNSVGRYRIIVNASFFNTSTNVRVAPSLRLTVNGTEVGSYSSTSYIRNNNGHDHSSLHLNEVVELAVGDVVAVNVFQEANVGIVNLRSVGSSNIFLEKIQ